MASDTTRRTFTSVRPVLAEVSAALRAADVPHQVGGSALLAALGLVDEVGDVDLTVPAGQLDAVRAACAPWVRSTVVGQTTARWCSDWLVRLDVDGVTVEVIGGFCVRTDHGPVRVPDDPGRHLDVDGVPVPLAHPAVWWWVYQAYRPAKAALLAPCTTAEERADVLTRLGPPRPASDPAG